MIDHETIKDRWPYRFRRHLLAKMLSGLLILIPFFIALFVLRIAFRMISSVISPILHLGIYSGIPEDIVTLLSVIILVLIVYLVGVLAKNSVGKKIVAMTEAVFLKIPFLKVVFSASKTAISALSLNRDASFHSVVFIEFPKEGYWTFGFVTGVTSDKDGENYFKIFMPTTPNPTTGFFMIVKQKEVITTDISVEEALQSILTGGVLFSSHLPMSSHSSDPAIEDSKGLSSSS
jgi:uncharacterized membrane protein